MTRYTANPTEISLVDVPCLPGATFEIVKNGIVEQRTFPAHAVTQSPASEPAAAPPPLPSPQAPPSQALAKAALAIASAADSLEKAVEENSRLRAAIADVAPQLDALNKRMATLEAQPQPARAALRAPPREWDAGAAIRSAASKRRSRR